MGVFNTGPPRGVGGLLESNGNKSFLGWSNGNKGQKGGEIDFPLQKPAAGGKFWGFQRCFCVKNASKMHSGTCFWYRNASKMSTNFRLRRAYCYRNPFSNVSKVYFFSRLRRAIIVFLCFILVYRAPLHKHKTLIFCFMLVYRALLDKHKTLNFGPLQRANK